MSYAAYVFDAYGTLFDVHAAVRRYAGDVGPDGQLFSDVWRSKQLEYSWVRALMGGYQDFWALTEQALDYAFWRVPSVNKGLRDKLLQAYWKLDCYPEVPATLKMLKAAARASRHPLQRLARDARGGSEEFGARHDDRRHLLRRRNPHLQDRAAGL